MNRRNRWVVLMVVAILFWPAILLAQYTLVLKNGRRITVPSYREEDRTIKVYGPEGEFGIPRDQIQSIIRAGEGESRGFDIRGPENSQSGSVETGQQTGQPSGRSQRSEEAGPGAASSRKDPPPQTAADRRAQEEREYQQKLREVTENLKATSDRYAIATRGSTGPEPSVPTTDEQIKARNDDLISRSLDVQRSQASARYENGVDLPTPVPPTGGPPPLLTPGPIIARPSVGFPPEYTEKQKELSDLRARTNQLEQERKKLIEEMKQKNLGTGSLFLE